MAKSPLFDTIDLDALVRHPAAPAPDGPAAAAPALDRFQTEDGGAWPQVPEPDREPQTGRMDTYFTS